MLVLRLAALLIVRRPDHAASPPCSVSANSPSFLTLPTPLLPNSVTRCVAFWALALSHTAVHRGGDAIIWAFIALRGHAACLCVQGKRWTARNNHSFKRITLGAESAARASLFGAEPASGLAADHENRPKP